MDRIRINRMCEEGIAFASELRGCLKISQGMQVMSAFTNAILERKIAHPKADAHNVSVPSYALCCWTWKRAPAVSVREKSCEQSPSSTDNNA